MNNATLESSISIFHISRVHTEKGEPAICRTGTTRSVDFSPAPRRLLQAIQNLRYRVYVREKGLELPGTDHAREVLSDPLDAPATHITATVGNELAGAVRLNLNLVPKGLESALRIASLPRPFVYCSRLNVLEAFRGKGVMQDLADASFRVFSQLNAAVAICHCFPHLFKLYERMGFQSYGAPFLTPGLEHLGAQMPFRCLLGGRRAAHAA
jgi:predicted GNAT family N-acyltransferase